MKCKVEELLKINHVLKSVIDQDTIKINALLKFRLLGIMRALDSHVTNFELIKNEKIIEYGEETENGVFQISKDNPEAMESFRKEISQILESQVTVDIDMLKPGEVFDQGLTSEYLIGLYPLITEQ